MQTLKVYYSTFAINCTVNFFKDYLQVLPSSLAFKLYLRYTFKLYISSSYTFKLYIPSSYAFKLCMKVETCDRSGKKPFWEAIQVLDAANNHENVIFECTLKNSLTQVGEKVSQAFRWPLDVSLDLRKRVFFSEVHTGPTYLCTCGRILLH
jgi:hypothetical protein